MLEVCAELCDFQGGCGWITQAALLKTAHWAVFMLSSATAPQLFESIRPALRRFLQNRKSSTRFGYWTSWWARVDYASRAAKNSPLGCFCAVFCDSAAAVRIPPPSPEKISAKQKIQYPVRILDFLVGAGGFEPPKLKAADLQSVPIGHSGTRPYTVFCSRGLPVYITTRERVCQLLFTAFSGKSGCWTAWFSRGDGRSGGSSWRGGGHAGR